MMRWIRLGELATHATLHTNSNGLQLYNHRTVGADNMKYLLIEDTCTKYQQLLSVYEIRTALHIQFRFHDHCAIHYGSFPTCSLSDCSAV